MHGLVHVSWIVLHVNRSYTASHIRSTVDLHGLAHVIGWKPYDLHDLPHVFLVGLEFCGYKSYAASDNGGCRIFVWII